ncbi:MAG: hypothetical protein M3466_10575 [Gemmatimonadota bacterium]|nr:hypothetical protein [Gemmatimonadota bacterium]
MDLSGSSEIEDALRRVGELLAYGGHSYAIVILGGAALNLLGIVERPTTDVDILAFASYEGGKSRLLHEPPEPMPAWFREAIRSVARDLGLEQDWLNAGPAIQWRAGLPPSLPDRVQRRGYDSLHVGIVARYDLIFFKLFASADAPGPLSVHYQDLLALRPTADELSSAEEWVRTQDAAPEFAGILAEVVRHARHDLGFDDTAHVGCDR